MPPEDPQALVVPGVVAVVGVAGPARVARVTPAAVRVGILDVLLAAKERKAEKGSRDCVALLILRFR